VTGATGFIGTHLLQQLRDEGYSVRALTRSPRTSTDQRLIWIRGDLADGQTVQQLVEGADAVVHCAGAVRGARPADFDAINVDGTARVAAAAEAAGVQRLLSLSSLAARQPGLSMYASSKRRGEEVLASCRVPWTLLRPPAVYGPGDKELVPLFRLMLRGIAIVPGHSGRTSLIYVTDLVKAIVAWLAAPVLDRRCFELDDGTPGGYDWAEMIRIATELRGSPIHRVNVPRGVLAGVGAVNLLIGRAFGGAPMLTSGKVRELFHPDWVCHTQEIRDALRWQPDVKFAEGLRLTFPV
jgi:nucleoside-diphosphate-sugar epimerase